MKMLIVCLLGLVGCLNSGNESRKQETSQENSGSEVPFTFSDQELDPCPGQYVTIYGQDGEPIEDIMLPALCDPDDWNSIDETVSNPIPDLNPMEWEEYQFVI